MARSHKTGGRQKGSPNKRKADYDAKLAEAAERATASLSPSEIASMLPLGVMQCDRAAMVCREVVAVDEPKPPPMDIAQVLSNFASAIRNPGGSARRHANAATGADAASALAPDRGL
jgi:hypothetical protein